MKPKYVTLKNKHNSKYLVNISIKHFSSSSSLKIVLNIKSEYSEIIKNKNKWKFFSSLTLTKQEWYAYIYRKCHHEKCYIQSAYQENIPFNTDWKKILSYISRPNFILSKIYVILLFVLIFADKNSIKRVLLLPSGGSVKYIPPVSSIVMIMSLVIEKLIISDTS